MIEHILNQFKEHTHQPVEMAECLMPVIVGGQDLISCRAHFDLKDDNIITSSGRQLIYHSLHNEGQTTQANIVSSKLKSDEYIVACEKLNHTLYVFTNYGNFFLWNLESRDWVNQLNLPLSNDETLVSCKMLSKRQYVYTIKDESTDEVTIYISMSRSERERPKQREAIGNCSYGTQNSFDVGCVTSAYDLDNLNKTSKDKASKRRVITFIRDSFVYFQLVGVGEKFNLELERQRIDEHRFTCVRANHLSPMIAVGDDLGRIYLYTGDFMLKPSRTKLHWHRLPVNDMCFSSTGRTLFSVGGESGCVVEWDLAQNNIGKKNVIPRLGMPIRLINCSQNLNLLVLSFQDNELQCLETSRQSTKLKTFTRRAIGMYADDTTNDQMIERSSIGMQWHSKTDTVITNIKPGRLQFYSPKKRCRIKAINFLKSDILTIEKDGQVTPSDITRASFTLDGDWLAFYETRRQQDNFPDVKLHIWQRASTTGRWGWIQTADRLHSSASIVDLKFSPNSQYLVSLCEDGQFHIFHRVCLDAKSNGNGRTGSKQMYAKGFTGQVPGGTPAMAAFSQDSSVLAISLKNDTTLIWMIVDAYKLVYEYQLNQISTGTSKSKSNGTPIGHEVLGLHFRHHEPSQSIAPLCEVRTNAVRIWNILNPQEKMEFYPNPKSRGRANHNLDLTAAAFDPNASAQNSDYFAVSAKNCLVYIFKMHIDPASNGRLSYLIMIDARPVLGFRDQLHYYTQMCFLNEPIVDIDAQCLHDPELVRLISRLCLMTNHQELIGITDKLTLERENSSNNCNQIKTVEQSDLLAYFEKSATIYDEETKAFKSSQKFDAAAITEKQRRIRNRLQAQKMLKELLVRIPSHNLPEMGVLGPMILNRLI